MCGIYGFAKYKNFDERRFDLSAQKFLIRFLALKNLGRGKDSTGICMLKNFGGSSVPTMLRKVKDAEDFLDSKYVSKVMDENFQGENVRVVLGHTRQATEGAINLANTQPFRYGDTIGVHNGIIDNFKELFVSHNLKPFTTCDSEILFALADKGKGVAEKAKLLGELTGFFATAFVDVKDLNKVYFAVDYSASLSVYLNKELGLCIFSSEQSTLDEAARILQVKFPLYIELGTDNLWELNLEDGTVFKASIPIDCTTKHALWYGKRDRDLLLDSRFSSKDKKTCLSKAAPQVTSKGEKLANERCGLCFEHKWCKYIEKWEVWLCKGCRRQIQGSPGAYKFYDYSGSDDSFTWD